MSLIYPCIHYDGGQCKKFSYPGVYSVCSCEECEYQESSNADRIRAMDDEELAEFLAYTWATSARAWQKDYAETLYWLQQFAGGGRMNETTNSKQLRQDEILNVEDVLNKYGISMMDNKKNFRPTNEVLIDICNILKRIRKSRCKKEFEANKEYILKTLVGIRNLCELY